MDHPLCTNVFQREVNLQRFLSDACLITLIRFTSSSLSSIGFTKATVSSQSGLFVSITVPPQT